MYAPLRATFTPRERFRRWAAVLAAYSNGDHLAVSGGDALRALAERDALRTLAERDRWGG